MERSDMEQKFWSRKMHIATIALRITTTVLLLISFVILISNVLPLRYDRKDTKKLHFYDVLGFKYMLATTILGFVYQILQTVFTIRCMKKGNYTIVNSLLDFLGDKVITNVLATGAVAGFIATREKEKWVGHDYSNYQSSFFKRSYGSAGLLLLSFICSSILSVISSYALPKKLY